MTAAIESFIRLFAIGHLVIADGLTATENAEVVTFIGSLDTVIQPPTSEAE